jgi:hypothetical protein
LVISYRQSESSDNADADTASVADTPVSRAVDLGNAAAARLHASGILNTFFACGGQYDYDATVAANGLPIEAANAAPDGSPDTGRYELARAYVSACTSATF